MPEDYSKTLNDNLRQIEIDKFYNTDLFKLELVGMENKRLEY